MQPKVIEKQMGVQKSPQKGSASQRESFNKLAPKYYTKKPSDHICHYKAIVGNEREPNQKSDIFYKTLQDRKTLP